MAKYARLDDANKVVELFEHPTLAPSATHIPDIAAQFAECPINVELGWVKTGDDYTEVAPTPATVVPPTVTPPQFKLLILPELARVLALVETDANVRAFVSIVDDPRLTEVDLSLNSVQGGIQYAFDKIGMLAGDIATRMAQILTGVPT